MYQIVGEQVVDDLFTIAKELKGKTITNINSTAVGGGVAEILTRMIPLLRELGVDAGWEVIKGNDRFLTLQRKSIMHFMVLMLYYQKKKKIIFFKLTRKMLKILLLKEISFLCMTHNLLLW